MEQRKQLTIASLIYILYVGIILCSNIFMHISEAQGNDTYEMISGILFGFIGIPILSLLLPIWLARRWRLAASFWPKKTHVGVVVFWLMLFVLLVNFEPLKRIVQTNITMKDFLIHYLSTLLFHITYYPLFVLLLFPVLRKNVGLFLSLVLTAFAFALYHLAQFHFYPAGTTFFVQVFLFCYFMVSLILYLWSQSLILVALVHQTTGAIALVANGSLHNDVDFLFYLTIPIMTVLFGYMIVQALRENTRERVQCQWWLHITID